MGYVSVKGGEEAIREAERLAAKNRLRGGSPLLEVKQVEEQLRAAVDQVMGEGGLYAPELAALAVKQSEGDLMEAAFLLRAYRTTLPRLGYSLPCAPGDLQPMRRISSAFKNIPGGQILGASRDYALHLLDFALMRETNDEEMGEEEAEEADPAALPAVLDLMDAEGIAHTARERAEGQEPHDVTTHGLSFPAHRSARLQALARGETGAMTALAYASLRGYGAVHPTIAELRVGRMPLRVKHPYSGDAVTVGEVEVTECHAICGGIGFVGTFTGEEGEGARFPLGYGLVFGRNERKAIAMSVLDRCVSLENPQAPTEDQEFVLYHIDGVDSMGFVEHLKLPHYVTFQSALDRLRSVHKEEEVMSRDV